MYITILKGIMLSNNDSNILDPSKGIIGKRLNIIISLLYLLNISKDTAKRTLNKLAELNLIKIECEGYSNRRIIYIPIENKWGTKKCQEEDQRRK